PIPLGEETGPNELLGHWLLNYKEGHPQGSVLDLTLPQQYVRIGANRRIADRLIWAGLGRRPDIRQDVATIAVEFVSAGKRNWRRDYVDKRKEYMAAGIQEYWIIDRFQRTLTVIRPRPAQPEEQVVGEKGTYQTPLLPGFELPLERLLGAADWLAAEGSGG
ncbi:MAG: Uma2 family endonuclease, partial [Planctomycetes bacterium]|nr:Uma2 family endonuclease [Planctomycetota bacterium]